MTEVLWLAFRFRVQYRMTDGLLLLRGHIKCNYTPESTHMDPENVTLKDGFPLAAPVVFRVSISFQGGKPSRKLGCPWK